MHSILPHVLRKRRDLDKGCVLVICPLNLIQSDQLRSLAQHDVPACSLSQDCRVNTTSGLQHSVEDVKVGKFDLIFAHPEALFNTMEEEALLFNKGFQKLIIAVVVIPAVESWLSWIFVCQSSLCAHGRSYERSLHINTLRPKQKAIISQTFSNAYSWMKMYEFRLKFGCYGLN